MVIAFSLCLVALIFTIILVTDNFRKKQGLEKAVGIAAASCFFQIFVFTIAIELTSGVSVEGILKSFVATKNAMGGNAAYTYLENSNLTGVWFEIFRVWIYALWLIAPFAAGGILVTTVTRVNSFFKGKMIKSERVYIFTENTERTRVVAETVYNGLKDKKSAVFVFICDEHRINEKYPTKCVSSFSEINVTSSKVKLVEVWDFPFDGKVRTSEIISFYENTRKESDKKGKNLKISLMIFSPDKVSRERYSRLFERINETDDKIFLRDIYEKLAVDVLTDYPLYNPLGSKEMCVDSEMNVLLIGCGKFGKAFINKIFSLGHYLNHNGEPVKVNVTVTDCDAINIEDRLRARCPEFINEMKKVGRLSFEEYDVEKSNFRTLVSEKDFDYCVISTGDDERNIEIQKLLQYEFIRKKIKSGKLNNYDDIYDGLPFIAVRIRDNEKANFYCKTISRGSHGLSNIRLFGSNREMFSFKNAFDELALVFYNINNMSYDTEKLDTAENIMAQFKKNSSKLKGNFSHVFDTANSEEEALFYSTYLFHSSRYFNGSFEKDYYFSDNRKAECNKLISLIHNRWRDSMLFDGFECPCDEDYKVYSKYNINHSRSVHKFPEAGYNRLLVPFEDLEKPSACDIVKVKMMPYIIDNTDAFIGKE